MHFKINRKVLLTGLQRVQGLVDRKGITPILSNILIEAEGAGVIMTATDLEIGIKGFYEAEVKEPGGYTLPAKKLYEIARELPEGEISISTEDNSLAVIKCGASLFRIMGLPKEDYPVFTIPEEETSLPLPAEVLKGMIKKTLYAVGESDTRYILNGLLLSFSWKGKGSKTEIRMVGTDGHRLAMTETEVELPKGIAEEESFILPKKGILELRRILEEPGIEEIGFGYTKNQVIFSISSDREGVTPRIRLISRLMEGTYPNYNQVIPAGSDKIATVRREDLEGALKRVSILSKDRANLVKVTIEENSMVLFSSNPEMGEAREEIGAKYRGQGISVGFNARYFLEALGAAEGDEVLLEFKDPVSPCLLKEKEQSDIRYLCVVMPMRL